MCQFVGKILNSERSLVWEYSFLFKSQDSYQMLLSMHFFILRVWMQLVATTNTITASFSLFGAVTATEVNLEENWCLRVTTQFSRKIGRFFPSDLSVGVFSSKNQFRRLVIYERVDWSGVANVEDLSPNLVIFWLTEWLGIFWGILLNIRILWGYFEIFWSFNIFCVSQYEKINVRGVIKK